ncbi:ABC transporter substrate-binding protein [Pollutimonas subterranea]|uniref:ABC transporter substrate-binding protein n=1 Tax=Pollutimonas subterranea TaxID=2045210 RepID=A0A2N4TZ18_9BURK|nr:tripartite tricarboxylate transporter substrate binding protein [Pollutimonas subterranea]PLC48016.1 ABC transporter substrate-binding protein [Pollutimonas subterranea]
MIRTAKTLLVTTSIALGAIAHAQTWPDQPIRWVVPYPAGGGTDVVARSVAGVIEKSLKQTIIIENRPGAGTSIGATTVARAEPKGYVVGTADSGTLAFNPALYSKLTYDPATFTYIGGLARFPLMLAVRYDSPLKSVEDVLAAAKEKPLSVSSAGAGSPHHLAMELFKQRTGADLLHVPYQGAAPAIQDLIGGQVDMMFIDGGSGLPNVRAGKLRVLATATPDRLAAVPDAPTMIEMGYSGFTAYAWQGLVGPAGMPADVVAKLNMELVAALQTPALVERITNMGVELMPMSSEEFKAYAEKERALWADVIDKAGIKLN